MNPDLNRHYYLIKIKDSTKQTMNYALLGVNDQTCINHLVIRDNLVHITECMGTIDQPLLRRYHRYLKRSFYIDQQLLTLNGHAMHEWVAAKIKSIQTRSYYRNQLIFVDLGEDSIATESKLIEQYL